MILYIAGPMTGKPDLNYPAFFRAEEQLAACGYEVLNPARNPGPHYSDYMRQGFTQVCQADAIALLDGWQGSVGAGQERTLAFWLGVPMASLRSWLLRAAPQRRAINEQVVFGDGS